VHSVIKLRAPYKAGKLLIISTNTTLTNRGVVHAIRCLLNSPVTETTSVLNSPPEDTSHSYTHVETRASFLKSYNLLLCNAMENVQHNCIINKIYCLRLSINFRNLILLFISNTAEINQQLLHYLKSRVPSSNCSFVTSWRSVSQPVH
jgi:hypothetical protein